MKRNHIFSLLLILGAGILLFRIGPWKDFDLKPRFRYAQNADMFWVYFASVLSILGVAGVIIIWLVIRKRNKR